MKTTPNTDFTLMALTFRCFQATASWYNIQPVRQESEAAI